MQAVVLAGGLGTRLRPLTLTRPKPLLPLANVAMIDRVIARLPKEVTQAIVAVNYMADRIEAHLREHPPPVETVVVSEPEPLGTGGAIKNCARRLTDTFLVRNADVYDSLDIARVVAFHREEKALATISLWPVDNPEHFGVVALKGRRITAFLEKPPRQEAPSKLINAGTYVLEPEVLDLIPPGRKVSLEAEIYPTLVPTTRGMRGFEFEGHWSDLGRPETYLEAHRHALQSVPGNVAIGDDAVVEGRLEPWCAVGERCRIEKGARVFEAVLLPGVKLARGAHVLGSLVGERCEVGAGAGVMSSVLGDGVKVKAGARIVGQEVAPGTEVP